MREFGRIPCRFSHWGITIDTVHILHTIASVAISYRGGCKPEKVAHKLQYESYANKDILDP